MVAKKKQPPIKPHKKVSEARLFEMAQKAMADFSAEAKKRYDKAHRSYKQQDDDTQDALDRMTTLLCRIARKKMWVTTGGRQDRVVMTIPEETVYHNMFYMAVEILKDLAVMDVRVANYTFPADTCVECGKTIELKPRAKKKVKS